MLEEEEESEMGAIDITLMPPYNALGNVTAEDFDAEDQVTLNNLSGSQLRAEVEIDYGESKGDYYYPVRG